MYLYDRLMAHHYISHQHVARVLLTALHATYVLLHALPTDGSEHSADSYHHVSFRSLLLSWLQAASRCQQLWLFLCQLFTVQEAQGCVQAKQVGPHPWNILARTG